MRVVGYIRVSTDQQDLEKQGSKNNKKGPRLSPFKADIERYVQLGLSVRAIQQLVGE